MKQGRVRHRNARQHHRTPSVICLPPPRLPVTPPREEREARTEDQLAIPLTDQPEALVTDTPTLPQNRQQRRQALRDAAKASGTRRAGRAAKSTVSAAVDQPRIVPIEAAPTLAFKTEAAAEAKELAPLPRSQSLARPRSGMMIVLDRMLRPLRRTATVPADEMRLLQTQLAAAQQTLNRLLSAA